MTRTATTPAAAASTTAALPTYCLTSELRAVFDVGGGAGGTQYSGVHFFNTGTRTCTVTGYPGVSYVAPNDGQQVGQSAERSPSASAAASTTVTLAPGAEATSLFTSANVTPTGCAATPVAGLRVYPPDNKSAMYLPFTQAGTICTATIAYIYPLRTGASLDAANS